MSICKYKRNRGFERDFALKIYFEITDFNTIFVTNEVIRYYQLIMNDLAPTIIDLKGKIEKLVKLHQQLKQENDKLSADNAGLLKTVEEQKTEIEALKKSSQDILQNKTQEQDTLITDTKLKINELVQEIDSCIALLNK